MAMEAISNLGVYQAAQPVIQTTAAKPQTERQDAQTAQESAQQAQAPGGDLTVAPVQETDAGSNSQQQMTEEQQEAQNERIKEAIAKLNKNIGANEEAVFGIHEGTNRVTIKMVDKETKKVVKEFPPDKTLDMIAKVWELAGIMVDERR